MLGGFTERKGDIEAENIRRAELASNREARIYETLIASPDAEVRALATAGLLESAQPKKRRGGLRGWLGELETSPIFTQLQTLIETPVMTKPGEPGAPGLPSRQIVPQIPTAPPREAPAGTPATSMTEPGAPPPMAISYRETPGPLVGRPPTPPTFERRRVFRTPEEEMLMTRRAAAQGDVEGEVAGLIAAGVPPDDARAAILMKYRRAAGMLGAQSIAGELPDGTPAFAIFDRVNQVYLDADTHQPIPNFRPRTTTGSVSLGQYAERAAGELGFRSAAAARAAGPDAMRRVNERAAQLQGEAAGATTTGRGEAAADIPLSTQQRFQATTDLQGRWQKLQAPIREMERQAKLMETGLNRFDADPIGGSQAVLVTFQKILDPASVVRESEYARSPQGLAILDRLTGYYERYFEKGGAGVPKPILAEMVETARQFLQGMQGWNDAQSTLIRETATSYGIDPRLIFEASVVGTPPPGAAAAPGAMAPNLFMGDDGLLHTGSKTGPLYKPGG